MRRLIYSLVCRVPVSLGVPQTEGGALELGFSAGLLLLLRDRGRRSVLTASHSLLPRLRCLLLAEPLLDGLKCILQVQPLTPRVLGHVRHLARTQRGFKVLHCDVRV